jgi:HPt (histidine-containing phosphotransfer) domain-containing protein
VSLHSRHERAASLAFDLPAMLRRFGGDEELIAEVIRELSGNLPELSASVRDAIEGRDAPALTVAAHRLCGALLEVAAFRTADLARQIETSAGRADVQGCAELWSGLSPLLATLAIDLEAQTSRP